MNEQVERLQAVLLAQREQVKEMERENRRLSNLKYTLEKKINNLEQEMIEMEETTGGINQELEERCKTLFNKTTMVWLVDGHYL